MPDPQPGQASKSYFQAAYPVNSHWIWVFLAPVIPQLKQLFSVGFFFAQAISFCESHQDLVPVEFPNHLRIADLMKVQVGNTEPWNKRSALAVNCIQMPVGFWSVTHSGIAEQVKPMPADLLAALHNLFRCFGKEPPKSRKDLGQLFSVKKEAPAMFEAFPVIAVHGRVAHLMRSKIAILCQGLNRPHTNLVPAHLRKTLAALEQ